MPKMFRHFTSDKLETLLAGWHHSFEVSHPVGVLNKSAETIEKIASAENKKCNIAEEML